MAHTQISLILVTLTYVLAKSGTDFIRPSSYQTRDSISSLLNQILQENFPNSIHSYVITLTFKVWAKYLGYSTSHERS